MVVFGVLLILSFLVLWRMEFRICVEGVFWFLGYRVGVGVTKFVLSLWLGRGYFLVF